MTHYYLKMYLKIGQKQSIASQLMVGYDPIKINEKTEAD